MRTAGALRALCAAAAFAAAGAAPAAEFANPDGVAVIIGNGDYAHADVPDVAYAHRDADAFYRYVVDVLGFDPENVIRKRDATLTTMNSVFGNERGHEHSELALHLYGSAHDVVVFYSGHGVPGLEDGKGYLLPVDAAPSTARVNGYALDTLNAVLAEQEKARSIRVFLDACFSGGSDGGPLLRDVSGAPTLAALRPDPAARMTVLAAATGTQVASWDREAGHGLFTHHLLDALYGAGDADDDGRVTASEAKTYLDRYMTRAALRAHRRTQQADLGGDAAAVLSAPSGGFPKRPVFQLASGGSAAGPDSVPPPPDAKAVEEELGLEDEDWKSVQLGLAALDFDPGPADGDPGPKTRTAISSWQDAKGYGATGYLTEGQAETLAARGREVLERDEAEKVLAVGEVFRDCPHCPEMVVVPAGSFTMGSPSSESGRQDREGPQRRVEISSPFAVGVYEVTRGEFGRFVSATGRSMGNSCWIYEDGEWTDRSGLSWRSPSFSQGDSHPVVCVSWDDARAYASWLSRETGKEYRLLSEAEWEYVARAGTSTRYWWGNDIGRNRANCWGDHCGDSYERTAPVGSFRANRFGLHDVHGNVWEWVEDCWHGNYEGAPRDGGAWLESNGGNCSRRVLRGGSWNYGPRFLRSALRHRIGSGTRNSLYGFRLLRSVRTFTP